MSDDSNETTSTETASLAEFRRRCETECRGGGIDRVGGVSRGEPGASRVPVFENAEAARSPPLTARCRSRCGEMTP